MRPVRWLGPDHKGPEKQGEQQHLILFKQRILAIVWPKKKKNAEEQEWKQDKQVSITAIQMRDEADLAERVCSGQKWSHSKYILKIDLKLP